MPTIYIRNVPEAVHRLVRSQAAAMGLTLAEWLERANLGIEALQNIHPYMTPGMNWTDEVGQTMVDMAARAIAPKGKE